MTWRSSVLCASLLAAAVVGCKKEPKAAVPDVPAQPVARTAPAPNYPSAEELTVLQNDVTLPAPQPVPEGALADNEGPLRLPPPVADEEPAEPTAPKPSQPRRPAVRANVDSGEPATIPPPQVGSVLSQAERSRYEREIDASLGATKRDLDALSRRTLNANQSSAYRRIAGFVAQAEEVRGRDLPLAKNLAERARLFMSELKRNLQ